MKILRNLNDDNSKKRKFKFVIRFLILIILISILLTFKSFDFIKVKILDVYFFLTKPAQIVTDISKNVNSVIEYQKILEDIKTENIKLLHKVNELKYIKFENEKLRKLLSLEKFTGYKYVGARIKMKIDYEKKDNFIFIDKGLESGIKIGDSVINGLGLVGRITQIGSDWSRVMLINNIGAKIPVLMQKSKVEALISGDSELAMVELVSENKELVENDTVVTAGTGESFPRGILVGKYQNKKIIPFVNYKNLDYVVVLSQCEKKKIANQNDLNMNDNQIEKNEKTEKIEN